MARYLTRRLIETVVLLVVVSMVSFALILTAPGGPSILMDPNATAQDIARMRTLLGLDDPLYVQYWRWLAQVLRGNLGVSMNIGRPVYDVVMQSLPPTLLLSVAGLGLAVLTAIPLGVASAVRRYSVTDHLSAAVSLFGVSIPVFWYGLMLIVLVSIKVKLFPAGGMYAPGTTSTADLLHHLVLPAFVLGTTNMAPIVRYTRSSMLTVLREDYVRTARAKGLAEIHVRYGHALRNALIPVVTAIGLRLPLLVGGAAVTETVFSWPGMGNLAVNAAFQRDHSTLMGVTLVVSAVVVLSNLFIDVLYVYLD
ncbi:MAG: ABC transporter permease, partial [Armatimonadetes bacterium]|nr:ABC transporter permease [Armatimonadota bacterium]